MGDSHSGTGASECPSMSAGLQCSNMLCRSGVCVNGKNVLNYCIVLCDYFLQICA